MVTGEDAETAGVVRQRLVHAELHREVRDARRQRRVRRPVLAALGDLVLPALVPARSLNVAVEVGREGVQLEQELLVSREGLQPPGVDDGEQAQGVATDLGPDA